VARHIDRLTKISAQVCLALLLLVGLSVAAMAQVNVYTRSYNTSRTGANLQETILTPANVNSTNFGKLFTVHVDGEVYAQPLYASGLAIAGGTHNVVFVATMRNSVYAIEADDGAVLWTKNFGAPINPANAQSYEGNAGAQNISNTTGVGIVSTPVIDPATNILYFVTSNQYQQGSTTVYERQLNALEIATGAPFGASPVNITATYSTPDLTAPLVFSALRQNNRAGLALANGSVYIAFASHDDIPPYNGWVLAYSASTLAQVAVYSDTTIGSQGGIWNAGQAPAVDGAGNLYFSTGNGSFGKTTNNLYQTGNSFIKLSPTLQLLDYFTPHNSASLNSGDQDLGSSGVLLLPSTNYVVGGGKQGVLYLSNTSAMGEFNASGDQVHQEFQAVYGVGTSHIHGTPSYFDSDVNGPTIYMWGENDYLRQYLFNPTTGLVNTTPLAKSTMTAPASNNNGAMPGGFTTVSANGGGNGIVWASTPWMANAEINLVQGVLYAFDANTLKLLWTDKTNDARDEIGTFAKYVPPVVANGKVYVPTFGPLNTYDGSGSLVVYGLLKPQLTVNVANASMNAGAALPTLTGTVTGLVNGDALGTTINVSYSTTATSSSPGGSYPIVATVSGSSASNYQVVVNDGTLTITSATAPTTTTLTAPANSTYGASVTLSAAVASTSGTPTGTVTFYNGTTSLGTGTLNGSGVATLTTTTLPGGTDSLVAGYAGTGTFAASYSSASSITVSAVAQTITFPAIASRAYGSAPFAVAATSSAGSNFPVTITVKSGPATINGGVVTLTGAGTVLLQAAQAGNADYTAASTTQSFQVTPAPLTVAANNAGRGYGAANPVFSGTVTGAVGSDSFTESFSTTATTTSNAGSYPIVPAASGASLANYTVTIVNGALSVTAATTTTSLNAPGSAAYGASVTLTATVGSTVGTPAGSVTFYSGSTALGSGTLNGGVASLSTTTLPSGTDSLTAAYAATGNYAGSGSTATSITINGTSQTVTFPAVAPRVYGSAPFAVTASSSLGSGYPVTITVQSGPAVINGSIVTITGAGTVNLLATQPGNAQYAAATATQSFQVTPAPLTVSANSASRAYGAANPTFSGTVTGAVGSDSFSESFTTTATANSNVGAYPIVPAANGPQLANYSVTVVNGTLTVTVASTTTTLSAPGSTAYGSSTTLTATVASPSTTPAGIVTFYSGTTSLGTGTLNGGVALLSTTALPVGTDALTAVYAGTGNLTTSTSSSSSINVTTASQAITFPAIAPHVYGSGPFAVSASSSLGSSYPVTIAVLSGPAVINGNIVTVTGAGAVVLKAMQTGDTDHDGATATQSFQVTPAPLTVTANPASRTYGAANPAFSGTVTGAVGSDSFSESFTTSATSSSNVGSYAIVPSASGSQLANYTVTVVDGTLTVNAAATATAFYAPVSATYGASVTLTATVTSSAGIPAGLVTFYSGSTNLGTAVLNGSGLGTLTITALAAGSIEVSASYAAVGNFAGSTSTAAPLIIHAGSQSIAFPAIGAHVYGSAPFAVTASSSLGSAYPVTISIKSGPATISGGRISLTGLGRVVLQASQAGDTTYSPASTSQSFQVTPAALTVAADSASRVYGSANPAFHGTITGAVGSDSFQESFATAATATSNVGSYAIVPSVTGAQLANYTVTSVNGALAVTAAATTTTLAAPSSAADGASVTLTATVASGAGIPGGSVTFSSGPAALGSGTLNGSGVATVSTTTLPTGSDTVTATYLAAGNFAGSTSPATPVTITAAPVSAPPAYTAKASPASLTIAGPGTVKTTLSFTPTGGYRGTIQLSCANLPVNASCQFDQDQVTLTGANQSVNIGLAIQVSGPQASTHESTLDPALLALAFWWPGSMNSLFVFAQRRRLVNKNRRWQLGLLLLCTGLLAAGVSGCGTSGVLTAATTTSQVTVVTTGTSGTAVTTQKIILTLNMTE
jgi:hypothetical protein